METRMLQTTSMLRSLGRTMAATAVVALLFAWITSTAYADNYRPVTDGDWNTISWEMQGHSTSWAWVPAAAPPTHPHKAYASKALSVSDSISIGSLEYAGGSITSSGMLTVNGSIVTRQNATFETDNTNFDLSGVTGMTMWNTITWGHDGTLDLSAADVLLRGGAPYTVTLEGSGLLSLGTLDMQQTSTVEIDRDLTTAAIASGAGEATALELLSGTTTTDDLFDLTADDTVAFSAEDALLMVLSTDLSVADALQGITDGYIADGVAGGTANPLTAAADGLYTKIGYFSTAVVPEPSTFVVFLGGLGALLFLRRRCR